MPNRIMWLELASSDIPASAKFYSDLFGWPIVKDEEMDYTMTDFEWARRALAFLPWTRSRAWQPAVSWYTST